MSERSHLDKTPNIPGSDKVVGWFGHWPRFHAQKLSTFDSVTSLYFGCARLR